ncbi:MAG: hypothetical protein D6719_08450 [Candidatus Dadabacteria bacterium]|nr:MAG: hypothetical protein D6719_08450 [Candidatus Dadabacteria bacterium]
MLGLVNFKKAVLMLGVYTSSLVVTNVSQLPPSATGEAFGSGFSDLTSEGCKSACSACQSAQGNEVGYIRNGNCSLEKKIGKWGVYKWVGIPGVNASFTESNYDGRSCTNSSQSCSAESYQEMGSTRIKCAATRTSCTSFASGSDSGSGDNSGSGSGSGGAPADSTGSGSGSGSGANSSSGSSSLYQPYRFNSGALRMNRFNRS